MNTKSYFALFLTSVLVLFVSVAGCGPVKNQGLPQMLVGMGDIPDKALYKAAWSRHDSLSRDQKFKAAQGEAKLILATA